MSATRVPFVAAAVACAIACVPEARPPANDVEPCPAQVWSGPTADATHVGAFDYARCDVREHELTSRGARDPSVDELVAFLNAHAPAWLAAGASGAGLGGCCVRTQPPSYCIHVDVPACTSVEEFAVRLDESIARSYPTRATRVRFDVAIVGRTGPRCAGGACGPVAYFDRGEEPEMPELARTKMRGYRGSGRCTDDGECIVGGCGNSCVPWTESHGAGTCEYRTDLERANALCGCVESACVWFTR